MKVLLLALVVSLAAGSVLAEPRHRYSGKKITIDLQEADIANVIRLIGDVSGKNVVFGDDVKGKVTLKLKNVPWDQALDVILRSHALGAQIDDGIIFVAPQAALDAEEQKALDSATQAELKGPLTTRIIPLNYSPAKEMADKVKALLSPRGTVTVDERTNSLIVRDVRSSAALRLP